MTGHGIKFGRKKEQAIAALLAHRNVEEAAKATAISVATLQRWMRVPAFKAAYLQARREVVFQTNARMQQNSGAAAAVLFELMADPTTDICRYRSSAGRRGLGHSTVWRLRSHVAAEVHLTSDYRTYYHVENAASASVGPNLTRRVFRSHYGSVSGATAGVVQPGPGFL